MFLLLLIFIDHIGCVKNIETINLENQTFGSVILVKIPGGEFIMGNSSCRKENGYKDTDNCNDGFTLRNIKIDSFWISKYEITQDVYMHIVGKNPSSSWGDKKPVHNISWYDAILFCNKLSSIYKLRPYYNINKRWFSISVERDCCYMATFYKTLHFPYEVEINGGDGFRLPTASEWEYACRGGTQTKYYYGEDYSSGYGNYGNLGYGDDPCELKDVGQYGPNQYGLYDMYGNVKEMCWDEFECYTNSKYSYDSFIKCQKRGVNSEVIRKNILFSELYRKNIYSRTICGNGYWDTRFASHNHHASFHKANIPIFRTEMNMGVLKNSTSVGFRVARSIH